MADLREKASLGFDWGKWKVKGGQGIDQWGEKSGHSQVWTWPHPSHSLWRDHWIEIAK